MPTDPAASEVAGEDIQFDYDGHTFTLPASTDDWPLDAVEALENGRAVTALKALIGQAQYAAWSRHVQRKTGAAPKARHAGELLEAIANEYGFVGAGE